MGEDKKKPERKTPANEIKNIIKNTAEHKERLTNLDITGVQIGKFTPEIKKILEELTNLQTLVAAECDLVSLEHLPDCPKLSDLDVSSNSLKDEDLKSILKYSNLTKLNVADNKITKLDSIKSLKGLKKLQILQTADNPIENQPNYHKFIFDTIKTLQILDSKDKNGQEVEMQDEEYDEEDQDNFEADDPDMGEESEDAADLNAEADDSEDEDQQFEEEEDQEESEQKPKKRR